MTDQAALIRLRDRLAKATGPDRELDVAIALDVGGWRLKNGDWWRGPGLTDWVMGPPALTASIDAAVTLFGAEWLLINLSDIAADGMSLAKFATTESPCREATGIGGRTLPLTICLARLEYELAKTEPT